MTFPFFLHLDTKHTFTLAAHGSGLKGVSFTDRKHKKAKSNACAEKALKQWGCEKVNPCRVCLSYTESVTTLIFSIWLFSRYLYSIKRKKYGKDISWILPSHICENLLVCKVHSRTMKFRVSFKFTLSLWYFQLSLRKGYVLTWRFEQVSFEKGTIRKNIKNAIRKKRRLSNFWLKDSAADMEVKNHLSVVLKTCFPKTKTPPTTLPFIYFWQISGILLSLQTWPLSLSLLLMTHHSHTNIAAQWINLYLSPATWVFWFFLITNSSGDHAFLKVKTNAGFEAF